MRMLDLFCGRWGWSRAFAARGWECVGVDIVIPAETPRGCTFLRADVLNIERLDEFDFICASPPCEQFSVHGMKHFFPRPEPPVTGMALFHHTQMLCEESGIPYVIENVRAAQEFVGKAVHHCGPFYLWGNAVPPLVHRGINKGTTRQMGFDANSKRFVEGPRKYSHGSKKRAEEVAKRATIPPELAACVAEYAERICEVKRESTA